MSDESNEIWELYADEGQQSLQAAEDAVLFLKKSPSDKETISSLFRSVHTFKGNSRVMGLSIIESRAHVAEDLIGMVRDEGVPIDDEIIDLLLEMIDVLNDMLATTCETQNDANPENSAELVERLKQKIAYCHNVETKVVEQTPEVAEEVVEIDDDFFAVVKKIDVEPEIEIKTVENEVEEITPEETNVSSYVLESETPDEMDELFENASFVSDSAVIFNPIDLAADPVYRDMFATMASENLLEMQQLLAKFDENPTSAQSELLEQIEQIDFAAQQLNFLEWESLLADFMSILTFTFQKSDAETLFENLKALLLQDFQKELPSLYIDNDYNNYVDAYHAMEGMNVNQEIANFFTEIKKPLNLVKAVYDATEFDSAKFITALDEIKALASPLNFVQLVSLIDDFVIPNRDETLTHQNVQNFLFWLFEALVAVEDSVLEEEIPTANSHIRTLLGYLCSKHISDNLLLIKDFLESIKNKICVNDCCIQMDEALRKIYYACQHYGLETASQLSISLVDLFARVTNGDMVVDGFMLHVAKSFVNNIELVLCSLESGIAPDMGQIEKLLHDAESVAFVSSGAEFSAEMVEERLNLPESFHNILSAESVQISMDALDAHQNFYIIRTDLEQDEELATKFLLWVDSGTVTAITNVTVFEDNRTLFDFLISTPLTRTQLDETLIHIDLTGKSLFITHQLEDHKIASEESKTLRQYDNFVRDTDSGLPSTNQGQMSGDMLESIGELVTNQAMMRHLLHDLVEEDLTKNIETKLNTVDGHWGQAKDDVRQYLLLWQDKVEKLIQIEVQTNALMEQLQEGAIAGRMRSAAQLLKPLYPFVESTSRQKNCPVHFITEGDNVSLDFTMVENLKTPLRTLLTFCMTQSIGTTEQRVSKDKSERALLKLSLIENDDHVKIIIEDDGIGIDTQNLGRRTGQLGLPNQLESIFHDAYGVTYNADDTENGVDFSKMRDTLQLHGGNIWVSNLVTGGLRFTLTMSLTMLLLEGMVVRINSVHYVIPIDAIQRIIRIDRDNLMRVSADNGGYLLHLEHNETVPVQFLKGNHQETNETNNFGDDEKQLFVVIGKESQRVAIKVSELIGQQNVLSRPLQGYLSHIRGVIGCTLLGSSDVGLVLDINAIFDVNN